MSPTFAMGCVWGFKNEYFYINGGISSIIDHENEKLDDFTKY